MADEATVTAGLSISVGGTLLHNTVDTITSDVSVANGPSPGAITVDEDGINIDLSQLAVPGLCRIKNLDVPGDDNDNYVDVGLWDGAEFFPLMELRPGDAFVFRFSRNFGNTFANAPGTGTIADGIVLRLKAYNAECVVVIEAYDS